MLEPDDARARILAAITPLGPVERQLDEASGYVLARDITSPVSLPLWPNSAMDGYACRAGDVARADAGAPVRLRVTERVAAGGFPVRAVGVGEAIRVATGAPVPSGADTVIRIEDTDRGDVLVEIRDARDAGRNVRAAGEDITAGQIALRAGTVLGPAQIALAAAVGAAVVYVHRRPRVAIISTGDELVRVKAFGEVMAGRRIVSSNSYGLVAAVRKLGAEPVDGGIVRDDRATLETAMERAASCDLIITTAGVSVGDADYVKAVVASLGGSVDFWRVRMRPGSPLAFGTVRGAPWLGLPGNPVSALVTFTLFAQPAILRLMGHGNPVTHRIQVIADEVFSPAPSLTHFVRVTLDRSQPGSPRARLAGPQASNILSSLAHADALMIVPPDRASVEPGDVLEAIPL